MSPVRLDFHPRAMADARGARRWYARRSAAVASQFVDELDQAMAQISGTPQQWSPYLHGTRVYRLHHFPYLIVYQELPGAVQVIAVAHGKRRPGYWRRRLPGAGT
jgi:plasmid stabilization system protein ParE